MYLSWKWDTNKDYTRQASSEGVQTPLAPYIASFMSELWMYEVQKDFRRAEDNNGLKYKFCWELDYGCAPPYICNNEKSSNNRAKMGNSL